MEVKIFGLGKDIMGKNLKITIAIVFLPITIIFLILKALWKLLEKNKIKKYLSHIDIEMIDSLSGHDLEEFLYYFFRNLNFDVKRTKASRDYGADLILNYKATTIVVQCKLYFNHNVGNSAIQEIATAKDYYSADKGIVITNSFFTKSAITLSKSSNITLIDRIQFDNLLKAEQKNKSKILCGYLV